MSVVSVFLMFFRRDILKNLVLVKTNRNLKKEKLEVDHACMSLTESAQRFEGILRNVTYRDPNPPLYNDFLW